MQKAKLILKGFNIYLITAMVFFNVFSSSSEGVMLCDFPEGCAAYTSCLYTCSEVAYQGYCVPWKDIYGKIVYVAFGTLYDCAGDSCECHPSCWGSMCIEPFKGECIAKYGGRLDFTANRAFCAGLSGAGHDFPEPACDPTEACCLGGGAGGGGSSSGGPSPITLISPPEHSPAPEFTLNYDRRNKVDRGLGMGWSHTYMYALEEAPQNGNVIALTEAGGSPWAYYASGDGNYEAAPYDRTVLEKYQDGFIATGKDGRSYIYNKDGRLENITDPNNNSLALYRDAEERLETVSDDFGRSLQLSYNSNGRLESVTDPNGSRYSFIYREVGGAAYNLIGIRYPDGTIRRFEYNDPADLHNLSRIIDNNNNTTVRYVYDGRGRIISKSGAAGSEAVETDYSPALKIFTDDFQDGIGSDRLIGGGTVEVVNDPDAENYEDNVMRLYPGSQSFILDDSVKGLKVGFDLRIGQQSSRDIALKIYNATEGEDYGARLNITSAGEIRTELFYDGSIQLIEIASGLVAEQWYRIEVEADARQFYTYFKVWVDCEYLGGHPFKRDTYQLDTVSIDAAAAGSDIYIDNLIIEEISMDGSKRIITSPKGAKETISVIKGNAYGGVSRRVETSGEVEEGCGSCGTDAKLYEFDEMWNLRRSVDADDKVSEMTYDAAGNMLSRSEAVGTALERTTTWTYLAKFNKVLTQTLSGVDPASQGRLTTYTYDDNGNKLSETVEGFSMGAFFSYTTSYQYNGRGQVTEIDGPRIDVDDVTTFAYHPTGGYLTSISYPNGTVNYSGYDADHNVGSITDLNGVTTSYTYDYAGRVKTISVGPAVSEYFYDAVGNIDYLRLPAGNIIDYEYDAHYRILKISDDLANSMVYDYDSLGNKIGQKFTGDNGTIRKYLDFEYDLFKRLKKIKNPDNSFTEFGYAGGHMRTRMIDPQGVETAYQYDELGRLTEVTQAKGKESQAITQYGYDARDNLVLIRDPQGRETIYRYDDSARLVETLSPDSGSTAYTYDESGNLIAKKDSSGSTVYYEYDALHRLIKTDFPDDPDIVYTYDEMDVSLGKGRLTTMKDASGTTGYGYDERGNIIEQRCIIDDEVYVTSYQYNLNNQIIQVNYPSGRVVEYGLNAIGNINSLDIDGAAAVIEMQYEPFGGLKAMMLEQSNIATTIGRDNGYRVKEIQAGNIVDRSYTHDFNGNITSIRNNQNGSVTRPKVYSGTDTYQYVSGTNKLQQINKGPAVLRYTYDPIGNVIKDGVRTYEYNQNNRLTKVMHRGISGQYSYNGKGQRVKKVAGGLVTIYHYDLAGNLIEETDESGALIADYVYAGQERLARVEPDGSIYYFHNDHLGTPLAMTDRDGEIVWRAGYTAFGKAQVDESSTVVNNFRFPGQYYDEESGLHYNYHRYYDPVTGRYLTPDPIGLDGGINLYAYVLNNPINKFDFYGLFVDAAGAAASSWADNSGDYIECQPSGWCGKMLSSCNIAVLVNSGGGDPRPGIIACTAWYVICKVAQVLVCNEGCQNPTSTTTGSTTTIPNVY